jgi:hypothetical protein
MFFEGDHSGYSEHARSRLAPHGHVNLSGAADVVQLLKRHGFELRSELDAESLERTYLRSLPEPHVRSWGPMRIAHGVRV